MPSERNSETRNIILAQVSFPFETECSRHFSRGIRTTESLMVYSRIELFKCWNRDQCESPEGQRNPEGSKPSGLHRMTMFQTLGESDFEPQSPARH
jgi:hypothetical protein